jgi:ABC-type sugar transport system substrate-binding protein
MSGVFVIGVDGNSTGYQQVKDGTQALSVGQSFTNMAAKSLELAKILIEGGTVDKENIIPMDMVTLDNINSLPWPGW